MKSNKLSSFCLFSVQCQYPYPWWIFIECPRNSSTIVSWAHAGVEKHLFSLIAYWIKAQRTMSGSQNESFVQNRFSEQVPENGNLPIGQNDEAQSIHRSLWSCRPPLSPTAGGSGIRQERLLPVLFLRPGRGSHSWLRGQQALRLK